MKRVLMVLLALAMTPGCSTSRAHPGANQTQPERKPLYYRAPMNPAETSPVPKKDAMGMDYVSVFAEEPGAQSNVPGQAAVTISAEKRRLIGLKTAEVHRGELETTIRTVGRVTFDETRIVKVQPRFEGFIEKLEANFTGKLVKKGETLAEIYSPELLATQQEFLLALKAHKLLTESGLPDAAESARARLRLFGVGDEAIDALAKSGRPVRSLPLVAPISGYVTAKDVVAGAKVGPDDALFNISDLSRVWVLADVYEYELPRVKLGQRATLTLSYWPDRTWSGRVSYVFPTVDEKTRTVRLRIEVENPKLELKPEMFADVVVAAAPKSALLAPEDAIIDSGTRKLVFVSLAEGRLVPREITIGDETRGMVEVRSGLEEREVIARGANFLLDSESQLKAAIGAMPTGNHQHGAKAPSGEHKTHTPAEGERR
jgi:RND family efflux transporter MFP subunit